MRKPVPARLGALVSALLSACAAPPPSAPPPPPLWAAPAAAEHPELLRIEPRTLAVRLGETVRLELLGERAAAARCSWSGVEGAAPPLNVASPALPGPVELICVDGEVSAAAQLTFTEAATLPVLDPYAGGVVLFKLARRPPRPLDGPVGRQSVGLASLDRLLRALGAYVLPAFPFDRSLTIDRVGLDRWIAVDLPPGVNFYQAVSLLRASPMVYAESYLPEDGEFLRVEGSASWPVQLVAPRARVADEAPPPPPRTPVDAWAGAMRGALGWELREIGAPRVWRSVAAGGGVGIAVIDTGVDVNHLAVSSRLRVKHGEAPRSDADGNGIPGDELGVNFAHLAIAHAGGAPRLALGLVSNLSDWDGAGSGRSSRRWGHGTAVASAAAGFDRASGQMGVAPGAWLLAVDVQENLRGSSSRWLEEDPRMRLLPLAAVGGAGFAPLRDSVWARAAGVAYAATEGVRVLTCAWPGQAPAWILHDALLYAEENCVIPVCALEREARAERAGGVYPGDWRREELSRRGAGTGAVLDAWTGRVKPDFFQRALGALTLVEASAGAVSSKRDLPAAQPDLIVPTRAPGKGKGVASAVSNPRNDLTPVPDRRIASRSGAAVAAGMAAGAAALVTARRPDLEPPAIRQALLGGRASAEGPARLRVPEALAHAARDVKGSCADPRHRGESQRARRSLRDAFKIKLSTPERGRPGPAPASPEPDDTSP